MKRRISHTWSCLLLFAYVVGVGVGQFDRSYPTAQCIGILCILGESAKAARFQIYYSEQGYMSYYTDMHEFISFLEPSIRKTYMVLMHEYQSHIQQDMHTHVSMVEFSFRQKSYNVYMALWSEPVGLLPRARNLMRQSQSSVAVVRLVIASSLTDSVISSTIRGNESK